MNNLIKFEFRKLFKSKSFFICLGVCLALVLLGGLTTKVLIEGSNGDVATPTGYSMMLGAIGSSSLTLIGAIFIALFVCEDETSGTIKNIYAKGYSRSDVFFSKYIVSLVAIIIYTISSMVLAYLFGAFVWPSESGMPSNFILSIVGQIIMVLAYHAIFFAISSKVGKTGSSIAFNIVGPMLVGMILTMVDAFLKLDNFKLSSYWLDSLLSHLQNVGTANGDITLAIVLGLVYSFIFIGAGFVLNKKKEI